MIDSVFVDFTTRPTARHTYDVSKPASMGDLSTRFMGTFTRLAHTTKVSLGPQPGGGTVRPNRFPQGTLQGSKTPVVSKGSIHHLHEASIGECVYTDTFETDDDAYRYSQVFVCYKSRYGAVYPLTSCTIVPASFQ